jgi:hypothetical protein
MVCCVLPFEKFDEKEGNQSCQGTRCDFILSGPYFKERNEHFEMPPTTIP